MRHAQIDVQLFVGHYTRVQRLQGRLNKLEKALAPTEHPRSCFRILADGVGELNLATSRCTRTLHNGLLSEVVILHGSARDLSDDRLEAFIESFPIEQKVAAW